MARSRWVYRPAHQPVHQRWASYSRARLPKEFIQEYIPGLLTEQEPDCILRSRYFAVDNGAASMSDRERNGQIIASVCRIKQDGEDYIVPSQAGKGRYRVRLNPYPSCTCPDYDL